MTTTALRAGALSSALLAGITRAAATHIISHQLSARGRQMSFNVRFRGSVLLACAAFLSWPNAPLSAQPSQIETAKPADAVSPYGVSYPTGSFTFRLTLLEIGNGDWPERLSVVLNYDSSANRFPNEAWSLNVGTRLSETLLMLGEDFNTDPGENRNVYSFSVVAGNTAVIFEKEGQDLTSGAYHPATNEGHSLTYEPVPGSGPWYPQATQEGYFVFTSRTGDVLRQYGIPPGPYVFQGEHQLADGNSATWRGLSNRSNILETNRGLAILIEEYSFGASVNTRRFCSYNFALVDRATVQDCSRSAHVATVTYGRESVAGHNQVLSVQRPDGQTYTFQYVQIHALAGPNIYEDMAMSPRTRYHLSCIKEPGQSTCTVQNEYHACDGPGSMFNDMGWSGSRDRVIRQTLGDGRIITYAYSPTSLPCRGIGSVTMSEAGASTTVVPFDYNLASLRDPLNRETRYEWTGLNPQAVWVGRFGLLQSVTPPEGDSLNYTYDDRGNVTEARRKARPNSGLPDLVQSAVYQATCVNPRTCNQPVSTTDARGNTTNYEYDPNHGGLLSVTGPADANGVRPKRRYTYQQRYAWLRSGGGYVQSASPVWLLASERFCRSSATVGDGCAGGVQDEVVTTYDYGPDSGPNNLWLRGQAVTAESGGGLITLRTCWSYDPQGRRISETQPNANLASCP